VQFVFAGKAHPQDQGAKLVLQKLAKWQHDSAAGNRLAFFEDYDQEIARLLVQGVDVWMNVPRRPQEASGTSGMTAAMNGAVNFSTDDGWIPEFIDHGHNGFVVPKADYANMNVQEQDDYDFKKMYEILEQQILPLYYDQHDTWRQIAKNGMRDVQFQFDSGRMAHEYYDLLYK